MRPSTAVTLLLTGKGWQSPKAVGPISASAGPDQAWPTRSRDGGSAGGPGAGVCDLQGCGYDLHPGGVEAVGSGPGDPAPGGNTGDLQAPGVFGCFLSKPELISLWEHSPKSQMWKEGFSPSSCPGDSIKPKTTEPLPSHQALSEGISLQELLTRQLLGDTQVGQGKDQDGPSEVEEGHLRLGMQPLRVKLPGKLSSECDSLGRDDGLHPRTVQEPVCADRHSL